MADTVSRKLVAAGIKYMETGGSNVVPLVFSVGASGPSFGNVQFDAGLPSRAGYSVLASIMSAGGLSNNETLAVQLASRYISTIKSSGKRGQSRFSHEALRQYAWRV